eukprot:m.1206948 g.1206948  ORF g.1206948 m.1206948 type:complete len:327 (+) comp24586_c0_seq27:105-1085(+)
MIMKFFFIAIGIVLQIMRAHGQIRQVFAVDMQPYTSAAATQPGFIAASIPADTGELVTVSQNGIYCDISGYSHRRQYGSDAYAPLLRDEVLLNAPGFINVTLYEVPPGPYSMTMYHSGSNQVYCGGCFPASVTAGGDTERQYFRVSNQYTLVASTKTLWNFTVGDDGRVVVLLQHTGTLYASSCSSVSCAEADAEGTCARCTAPNAHLALNGLALFSTAPSTITTTTTTTATTHTVQQDTSRALNALASTQEVHEALIRHLRSDLSTVANQTLRIQSSIQSTLQNTVLATDLNTEAIQGGSASGQVRDVIVLCTRVDVCCAAHSGI